MRKGVLSGCLEKPQFLKIGAQKINDLRRRFRREPGVFKVFVSKFVVPNVIYYIHEII